MEEGTFFAAKRPAPEHPLSPATAAKLSAASRATESIGGIFRIRLRIALLPKSGSKSPRASGRRSNGEDGGVLKEVVAVVTVMVILAVAPPAARVGGEKLAFAPAGSPLAERFTM